MMPEAYDTNAPPPGASRPDRFAMERAILGSSLSKFARLIAWPLLTRAVFKTCVIPAAYGLSYTELVRMTDTSRQTVARALAELEATGWLVITRPPVAKARAEHVKNGYRFQVPAGALGQTADPRTAEASSSQELAQADQTSAPSSCEEPELVPARTRASAQEELKSDLPQISQINRRGQFADKAGEHRRRRFAERENQLRPVMPAELGATADEERRLIAEVERIAKQPIRDMGRYLAELHRRGELRPILHALRAPERDRAARERQRAARNASLCPHDGPSGFLSGGEAMCPLCRRDQDNAASRAAVVALDDRRTAKAG